MVITYSRLHPITTRVTSLSKRRVGGVANTRMKLDYIKCDGYSDRLVASKTRETIALSLLGMSNALQPLMGRQEGVYSGEPRHDMSFHPSFH